MARLVLINGTPASGKSTLGRRYVDAHPLTLALDIDLVRSMLGGWLDHPADAGRVARRMALEIARVQLGLGRDVLVPQYLGRIEFVLELERLCGQTGADFVEVALLSDPAEAAQRFRSRSSRSGSASHRDAWLLQERSGGMEGLAAMYDRLLDVVSHRRRTAVIATVYGDVAGAYRDLCAAIDGR